MASKTETKRSAFDKHGLKRTVDLLIQEMQALYCEDAIPWIVGYSGGKDSTAVLQLTWMALSSLKPSERRKEVHVISTDTRVENPVVSAWVGNSLETMNKKAVDDGLPLKSHRLEPIVEDTFWVNLIGKGYPAPRHKFRWCTERLKIRPSNRFILEQVRKTGEAILLLGTRKAESQARERVMRKYEGKRMRDNLSPNASLPNCLVYSPIEDWTNDDVWLFLMQVKNPWGITNKDLLTMYQGASAGGECPLVVDKSTPSCGDSRFGCWVCTLVDKDKSMHAMIQNDVEKEWMLPLLNLRNELDLQDDRPLRDFRRMSGEVQLFHDRPIHGPYLQSVREDWLRKVLKAQQYIRRNGPKEVRNIELISMEEIQEIRRIWVIEKHEIEDSMPVIYQEEMGEEFPTVSLDDQMAFGADEMRLLKNCCAGDRLRYEMLRDLINVEHSYRTSARRAGLFEALEKSVRKSFYDNVEDAVQWARLRDNVSSEEEQNGVSEES